jgi:CRISPR-associated protein Csb1
VLDSHRLNTAYILDADGDDKSKNKFVTIINDRLKMIAPNGPIITSELAKFVFYYCPNTLIHGVFFANKPHNDKIGSGRLRLPRVLSSFIEASGVQIASSGGAKLDRQDASGKNDGGSAETGYGNVPFPRDEFTAKRIVAYFNLDLAQIRGFRLSKKAEKLLIAFALYKVRRLLSTPLRLRTACDLILAQEEREIKTENGERKTQKTDKLKVTSPDGYTLPKVGEIEDALPGLIQDVTTQGLFVAQPLTVIWREPSKGSRRGTSNPPQPNPSTGD